MTHKLSVELDPLNGRVRVYPVPEIETPADWRAFKEWLEGLEWAKPLCCKKCDTRTSSLFDGLCAACSPDIKVAHQQKQ